MTDSFNYEKHSYCYQEIDINDKAHGAYMHMQRLREFLESIKQNAVILDYGCGAGAILRAVQKLRPDLKLVGADVSNIALSEAKSASKQITYELITNEKLPFADNFFDAVIMFEVLEHVPTPSQTLYEIYRVLKPDGSYFLAVPQEKSKKTIQGLLFPFFKKQLSFETAGHIQFWNEKELIELLETHKFNVIKKTYAQHLLWQIIGVSYMILLRNTNKQTQELSKELEKSPKIGNKILASLIRFLIYLTNVESTVLKNVSTGLDIQFVTTK